ncbi:MAG TPA: hypothetical protein VFA20_00790 [Myxococcaceae bacterium]|nr:hypothetical protein [Myxococcaceae bacterium]
MKNLRIAVLAGLPLALSCMTGPLNGATHGGSVVGASFSVNGYSTGASTQIDVQVLMTPASDATVDANWTTLTTTYSSATATSINGDNLYSWSTNVVPVPSALYSARWPSGGLVKLRAVARASGATYNLLTFDAESWSSCSFDEWLAGTPGQIIGTTCQGLGRNVTSLVSTLNNPADDLTSPQSGGFLGLKGSSSGTTKEYYDSWAAPATLADFKTKYGYPGTGDVTATYYNDGDLGIGREMHCWKFTRLPLVGTACYVTNYSDTAGTPKFGTNNVTTTLSNAIAHTGAFATVAMVTERTLLGAPGAVNFVVYDAGGSRVNRAQLDNANVNRTVPNNCLTCHGVDSYYDPGTYTINGRAAFLPFDLAGYRFSTSAGYTRSAQEEAFRNLNKYVRDTTPPAAVTGLIDGSYLPSAVTTTGATWNDDWVPDAWKVGSPREDYPTLYKGVVKSYCRTCHISAGPSRDFAEASDFDTLKAGIMDRACGTTAATAGYFMPQAEHPFRLFWSSGARAYLNAWGGDAAGNGCKP